jgi:hypothetical protein
MAHLLQVPRPTSTVRWVRISGEIYPWHVGISPAHVGRFERSERVVDGFRVAVWDHSHASIFGAVPTRRVCQAWFGTRIGPDGLYGEARRAFDHRVKSIAGANRGWFIIDRKPTRGGFRQLAGARLPRYFALTATDPDQVRFWLTDDRLNGLMRTAATTLTPFDLRLVTRPRSGIDDTILRNLVSTARLLI